MAAAKPWRDWMYLGLISSQLFGMLALDLVAFYPKALYASPSAPLHFLVTLRTTYVALAGDPNFAHDTHDPWFRSLLLVEGLVQLPLIVYLILQLASRKASSGPAELAGLAYGCVTGVAATACCAELWAMGPEMIKEEQKVKLFYGAYVPYAVIPAVMAVDMALRLLPRVQEGPSTKAKTL